MHSLISLLCFAALPGGDVWIRILDSVRFDRAAILVPGAVAKPGSKIAITIVEGDSEQARALGFRATSRRAAVHSVIDSRNPSIPAIWERPVELPVFDMPGGATVFAKERWSGAPLMAGLSRPSGAVLWLATSPGERGYERYPYLPQALYDLGARPMAEARDLWAFFDPAYRWRVDLDYFARHWRKAGIAALHVAAWRFNEPDAERDRFLQALIEACHRQAILVYAWLELPHVSEQFWNDHPEWREKTAIGQDAHLDWRLLMNLQNPDCRRAAAEQTQSLIHRFDWDGVNIAELYFESLEGHANPSRFTPFNDDVRKAFRKSHGVDPIDAIRPGSPALGAFLEFRAELARRLQEDWLRELEQMKALKPHLDLVLTHVDDRLDTNMRAAIGADAARVMPLLERTGATFLVEDPATVWHLGPERYPQIAQRYRSIARRPERLAVDINIVERYQDVYPTKQQTGVELFQLVQAAASSFSRVALYFENSIPRVDWPLLPASAAVARRTGNVFESERPAGLRWAGNARVNGKLWPAANGDLLWLPAGRHQVSASGEGPDIRLTDLNGVLLDAECEPGRMLFRYRATSRAIALLDRAPSRVLVDGRPIAADANRVQLPPGEHRVIVIR